MKFKVQAGDLRFHCAEQKMDNDFGVCLLVFILLFFVIFGLIFGFISFCFDFLCSEPWNFQLYIPQKSWRVLAFSFVSSYLIRFNLLFLLYFLFSFLLVLFIPTRSLHSKLLPAFIRKESRSTLANPLIYKVKTCI